MTPDELKIFFDQLLETTLDRTEAGAIATWLLNHGVSQAQLVTMAKAMAQARKDGLATHQTYVDDLVAKCDEVLGM